MHVNTESRKQKQRQKYQLFKKKRKNTHKI